MAASRQVKMLFYRGIGRQRGREFGALAQVIGRTTIPFLRNYIVPAAKRVGADLLEFAVPELDPMLSCCMLNWEVTSSPLPTCETQI